VCLESKSKLQVADSVTKSNWSKITIGKYLPRNTLDQNIGMMIKAYLSVKIICWWDKAELVSVAADSETSDPAGLSSVIPCKKKKDCLNFIAHVTYLSAYENTICLNSTNSQQEYSSSIREIYLKEGWYIAPLQPLDSCSPTFAKHSLHNVISTVDHS
jgi:hypothetical protein